MVSSELKGQFVFEFMIAGIIFFVMIVYAITFVNTNIQEYSTISKNDILNIKSLSISDVLMDGDSSLSLTSSYGIFNWSKITLFNETYCKSTNDYVKLVDLLGLYEQREYGIVKHNIYIKLGNETDVIFNCGPFPTQQSVHTQRVGILSNKSISLDVFVW